MITPHLINDFTTATLRNAWQWSSARQPPQLPGMGGAIEIGADNSNSLTLSSRPRKRLTRFGMAKTICFATTSASFTATICSSLAEVTSAISTNQRDDNGVTFSAQSSVRSTRGRHRNAIGLHPVHCAG